MGLWEGTLILSDIRRLGPFMGSNFEFLGGEGFRKIYFLGGGGVGDMMTLWAFFFGGGGASQNWTIFWSYF